MPVRTRAHDYAAPTEALFNEQMSPYHVKMLADASCLLKKIDKMSHLQKMIHIQKMFAFNVKLVRLYTNFLKSPHVSTHTMEKLESLFRTIVSKKKSFETEHDSVYWRLAMEDREPYEKHYLKLMDNCEKANALIFDYFNHKYAVVLLKSNADVYRNILSFL